MAEKLETINYELRRSTAWGHSISKIAPNAHIVINQRGIIMSVNPETEQIFGYCAEQLIGKNVKVLIPPTHRERHNEYIQSYLKTGIGNLTGQRQKAEMEAVRKNGQKFPVNIYISEAKTDKERFFVSIIEDITERKRLGKELKEKNNLIQLMLGITVAASEALTIKDAMLFCLSNICKYTGWPIGHAYEVVYSQKSMPALKPTKLWQTCDPYRFKTFRSITEITSFACGEGLPGRVYTNKRPVWITDVTKDPNFLRAERARAQNNDIGVRSAFAFPALEKNKVVAVLEFFSDKVEEQNEIFLEIIANFPIQLGRIAERKRYKEELKKLMKKLEKANEDMKSLASIVSHDLRSPLLNLKGFSKELENSFEYVKKILKESSISFTHEQQKRIDELLQKDVPEALGFIDSSAFAMNRMISNIFAFAQAGKREFCFEKIMTGKLVEEIIGVLRYQIESKGIKVALRELPDIIADESSIEQTFGNIIVNAINYLDPDRPGVIEISGKRRTGDTLFSIKDNGRGIAKEDRHKVFELFRRVGKPAVFGEGMGLAFVKELIERHNGEIWFESQKGVGTTFHFTIQEKDVQAVCSGKSGKRKFL